MAYRHLPSPDFHRLDCQHYGLREDDGYWLANRMRTELARDQQRSCEWQITFLFCSLALAGFRLGTDAVRKRAPAKAQSGVLLQFTLTAQLLGFIRSTINNAQARLAKTILPR